MGDIPFVRTRSRRKSSASFRRVLFVDPDPAARSHFVRLITSRGFLVDTAEDARDALRLAGSRAYPVVVVDASEGAGGLRLVRELRRCQPRASLVLLAHDREGLQVPAEPDFSQSVVSLLDKPWDADELVDTIHRSARLWQARSSRPPPAGGLPGERILLIEDDDYDAELVEDYLAAQSEGFAVQRVRELKDALILLDRQSYDAIVADLSLPDARGLDAVLRLQTLAAETPLIVVSGLDDEHVAIEAVEAGAQDYLVKGALDGGGLVRSIRYARERKRTELELSKLANFDPLTGLVNRNHFSERLAQVLMRARRTGEHFAVFYLDLDGFKGINDTLGHAAGDAVLSEVARRLEGTARESDVLARLGGDEFAAVADGLSDPTDAVRAADRILSSLARPHQLGAREVRATASIGIAFFPAGGETATELLKAADQAMYAAKGRGGNTYEVYGRGDQDQPSAGVDLNVEIKRALYRNEFVLYYQPQYHVASERLRAAEGLLRWRRAGARLVPPAEFLPVLEASGDIQEAGEWAIQEACKTLKGEQARLGLFRIAVNVSARQFDDDGLVDTVRVALRRHHIDPNSLELEVTESAVMKHPERARDMLFRLKELGIRIAMDDFGTGQSSLSHLYRLPFDTVKIDRSFVNDMGENEKCRDVTRAIIALAKRLNLEVVAEGVETAAQRDFLIAEGCDYLQGYLFSAAVPAEALSGLVSHHANVTDLRPPRRTG